MAAFVKFFIVSIIVAFMIAASVNCEKASSRRLLQSSMADPPQAEPPQQLFPTRPRPGCSLGPVCPPGNTIICENDAETGETGGCICTLVHLCHPERKNCTFYSDSNATGMPCGF
ncbi:hypothetical protein M758_5G180600 [Ceratodon purpureus]|nr:hypothetical protein M758_5G180600 [Ceratodon purpureus]